MSGGPVSAGAGKGATGCEVGRANYRDDSEAGAGATTAVITFRKDLELEKVWAPGFVSSTAA